jgi:hypothetical protein
MTVDEPGFESSVFVMLILCPPGPSAIIGTLFSSLQVIGVSDSSSQKGFLGAKVITQWYSTCLACQGSTLSTTKN